MALVTASDLAAQLRSILDANGSGRVSRRLFEEALLVALPGLSKKELDVAMAGYAKVPQAMAESEVDYERFLTWLYDEPSASSLRSFDSSVWVLLPGLGDQPLPGFPVETCPDNLPDLSNNPCAASQVLRTLLERRPSLYADLRQLRTDCGATFSRCMKPGMDAPRGSGLGAVACDSSSYEVFASFFDPLLKLCHQKFAKEVTASPAHPHSLDISAVREKTLERATTVRVVVSRNLKGLPFPPACSRDQRIDVENRLSTALRCLAGNELAGRYRTFAGTDPGDPEYFSPFGLSKEETDELVELSFLFNVPQSTEQLAAGLGQHWPDGRGIFVSDSRRLAAWVNYSEHLQMVSLEPSGDVRGAFSRLCEALASVEQGLSAGPFARSERLGFLTANPAEVGTGGLRVVVTLRLSLLSARPGFRETCRGLGLSVRPARRSQNEQLVEVANSLVFGVSESELVEQVLTGCEILQNMEAELEAKLSVTP